MVINIRPAFTHSYINILSKVSVLTSLAVQWLGLHAFTRMGTGSIPGQGTKIPQTAWCPPPKNIISVVILLVICTRIGPPPLPCPWEHTAPTNFLGKQWPN